MSISYPFYCHYLVIYWVIPLGDLAVKLTALSVDWGDLLAFLLDPTLLGADLKHPLHLLLWPRVDVMDGEFENLCHWIFVLIGS
jgi:hypothetical protein